MSKSRQLSNTPNRIGVSTVDELLTLTPSRPNEIVVVTDKDRGGIFHYDETAVDDGGTVFGKWVRQYSGAVNVKWFGLSTTVDESIRMQSILDTFSDIYIDSLYLVKELTLSNQTVIKGNKWTTGFKFSGGTGNLLDVTGDFCVFDSISFQGGGHELNRYLVRLVGDKCSFNNCLFTDMYAIANKSEQYGLKIEGQGVADFSITKCRFSNLRNTNDDDIQAGTGFSGGIFISSITEHTNNGSYGSITNCEFRDIITENTGGNVAYSDADGIRFYAQNTFGNLQMNVIISDCSFRRVMKSAIKASGISGLVISDISIDAKIIDGTGMLAGIRLQDANNSTVSNVSCKGEMLYGFNIRGHDIQINGVTSEVDTDTLRGIKDYILQIQETDTGSDDIKEQNISLSNVTVDKVGGIVNLDGTGINKTSTKWFKNINISNVNVNSIDSYSTSNRHFSINNVQNFTISNCTILDDNGVNNTGVSFINSSSISISNTRMDVGLQVMNNEGSSETSVVSVSDSSFKVSDSAKTNSGKRVFYIRNNISGILVQNVKLSNINVSVPTYDALVNSDTFIVFGEKCSINNIQIDVRSGDGYRPPSHFNTILSRSTINNVVVNDYSSATNASYILNAGSSNNFIVSGISCADAYNRGIGLGSSNNGMVDNIAVAAGEVKVDASESTNIITGTNIINWV